MTREIIEKTRKVGEKIMKIACKECDWHGTIDQMLVADNPFQPSARITGCPYCLAVESVSYICDEPDCRKAATCAIPTKNGCRQTCGDSASCYSPLDADRRESERIAKLNSEEQISEIAHLIAKLLKYPGIKIDLG